MTEESANTEVFRHSTMNRVASSEELDRYIKVTNPSAWVVVLAALLLIGGVLIWALTATVPVTIETTGIVPVGENPEDSEVLGIVNKTTADLIEKTGAKAFIDGVEAESVRMRETPLSASEALKLLGSDFYADSIDISDWNYLLIIKPSGKMKYSDFEIQGAGYRAHLVPLSIVVSETQPIRIVTGSLE